MKMLVGIIALAALFSFELVIVVLTAAGGRAGAPAVLAAAAAAGFLFWRTPNDLRLSLAVAGVLSALAAFGSLALVWLSQQDGPQGEGWTYKDGGWEPIEPLTPVGIFMDGTPLFLLLVALSSTSFILWKRFVFAPERSAAL